MYIWVAYLLVIHHITFDTGFSESDSYFPAGTEAVAAYFTEGQPILCCADHIITIPLTISTTTTTPSAMQPGPIISPSLGIDHRAGESQLAAREDGGVWFL